MAEQDGRRKALLGTNLPMISHNRALEGVEDLGLDDQARGLFLHRNTQPLLKLSSPDSAPTP